MQCVMIQDTIYVGGESFYMSPGGFTAYDNHATPAGSYVASLNYLSLDDGTYQMNVTVENNQFYTLVAFGTFTEEIGKEPVLQLVSKMFTVRRGWL